MKSEEKNSASIRHDDFLILFMLSISQNIKRNRSLTYIESTFKVSMKDEKKFYKAWNFWETFYSLATGLATASATASLKVVESIFSLSFSLLWLIFLQFLVSRYTKPVKAPQNVILQLSVALSSWKRSRG